MRSRAALALVPLAELVALAAPLGAPQPAVASPCCAGSTTPGFEHLALWETVAGGVRVGYDRGLGAWDAEGTWRWHEAYSETAARAELWVVGRPTEPLQLGLRLPYLHTWRRAGALSDDGGGPGDAGLSVRWDFFPAGEGPVGLGVAAVAGLVAPTGQETETAQGPLAADVTGEGHWVPSFGLVVLKPHGDLFLRFQTNLGVPLARRVAGHESRRGLDLQSALVGGFSPQTETTLSLSLGHRWQAESALDGRAVPDSGRSALTGGLGLAWDLPEPAENLALQGSFLAPLPFDGAGSNTLGALSFTFGLRVGWP